MRKLNNILKIRLKSIWIISLFFLLIGCQFKVKDQFDKVYVDKQTRFYYDCELEVIYKENDIFLKTIINDSINRTEKFINLKKQDNSFVLDSITLFMGRKDKLIRNKILSDQNFYYSVVDTLHPLKDVYKIDVYNYNKGDEFVSTISQYCRPKSWIRIYYNKDFHIHKVKIVFGVDEFVFESRKYKKDNFAKEEKKFYPVFFNDIVRDSLNFIEENQYSCELGC